MGYQIVPEFVQTCPLPEYATAASLVPSAEDATEYQFLTGAEFEIHVAPESVDV